MKVLLLLILIWFNDIESKIVINVESDQDTSINYSGVETELASEDDVNSFFTDTSLKDAVKIYLGAKPTDVYFKKPTPWGDLYTRFDWEQVRKIISIKSARVNSITKKPVVILSQDFENFTNNTIKVNTGISHTVENTITTSWSKSKEWTLSQEIEYNINVFFAKLAGSTGISYTSSWGQNEEKSESVMIGSTSAVETELQPGQSVTAQLSVNSGFLEIEVVYKESLRGNVAVNFKKRLGGHYFWGPLIKDVMKTAGVANEKTLVEIIRFGYHIDAKLKVIDKATGLPL